MTLCLCYPVLYALNKQIRIECTCTCILGYITRISCRDISNTVLQGHFVFQSTGMAVWIGKTVWFIAFDCGSGSRVWMHTWIKVLRMCSIEFRCCHKWCHLRCSLSSHICWDRLRCFSAAQQIYPSHVRVWYPQTDKIDSEGYSELLLDYGVRPTPRLSQKQQKKYRVMMSKKPQLRWGLEGEDWYLIQEPAEQCVCMYNPSEFEGTCAQAIENCL